MRERGTVSEEWGERAAYRVVLFDLDGTLTDPKPGITRSVQYALRRLGIVVDDLERLTPFIGPPLAESFRRYYHLSDADIVRAIASYREYFGVTGLYENAVYPGIPALLETLTQQGATLAVATSKPTTYAERILTHFDLTHHFALVAGSNLDGTRTAKVEVIEHALATLPRAEQLQRAACVMIGDREHDVLGARAAGIASIAVAYGYGSLRELAAARPAHLARSVAELAALLLR